MKQARTQVRLWRPKWLKKQFKFSQTFHRISCGRAIWIGKLEPLWSGSSRSIQGLSPAIEIETRKSDLWTRDQNRTLEQPLGAGLPRTRSKRAGGTVVGLSEGDETNNQRSISGAGLSASDCSREISRHATQHGRGRQSRQRHVRPGWKMSGKTQDQSNNGEQQKSNHMLGDRSGQSWFLVMHTPLDHNSTTNKQFRINLVLHTRWPRETQ
jgi:hypothetical protein